MLTASEREVTDRALSWPMLDQTLRWAHINSGTGNLAGLSQMAGVLADEFAALPGEVALVAPDISYRVTSCGNVEEIACGRHLRLSVRPDAPIQLLFTGHMDTVFGADHAFQACRWLEADLLNGPGVADMKGGIAVMLAALRSIEACSDTNRFGYDVVINSDEETGSLSSAALLSSCARGKVAALTYEPALPDGSLAGARAGSGNFSIVFRGRKAHAGRNPEEGRNAIVAAADLALRLRERQSERVRVNPARIEGGSPNNVVPDLAILRVNIRPMDADAFRQTASMVQESAGLVGLEHDVRVEVHGGFNRPPKPIDPAPRRLFEIVRDAGSDLDLDLSWKATGGVCDGNNIAACGVPVVDTMGPCGGALHSEAEFLATNSLGERAALSALTISRIVERGKV